MWVSFTMTIRSHLPPHLGLFSPDLFYQHRWVSFTNSLLLRRSFVPTKTGTSIAYLRTGGGGEMSKLLPRTHHINLRRRSNATLNIQRKPHEPYIFDIMYDSVPKKTKTNRPLNMEHSVYLSAKTIVQRDECVLECANNTMMHDRCFVYDSSNCKCDG